VDGTSWADGLELIGDDKRLIAHTGVLPLRLLGEQGGLRAGLSTAMRRRGFDPVYDRGQVLLDLGLMMIDGGEAISDFQALTHLAPITGAVPSPRLGRRRWPPEGSPGCPRPGRRSFAAVPLSRPGRGTSRSPGPPGTWDRRHHACVSGLVGAGRAGASDGGRRGCGSRVAS
jgi:hypothetical protein